MGDYPKNQEACFDKLCDTIDSGFTMLSESIDSYANEVRGAIECFKKREDFMLVGMRTMNDSVNQFKILNSSLLQMTAMLKDIAFNTGRRC